MIDYNLLPVYIGGQQIKKGGWYLFQVEGKRIRGTVPELREKFGKPAATIVWWKYVEYSTGRIIEKQCYHQAAT